MKDVIQENVIEFLNGDKYAWVTFSSKRHINKIKKIHTVRSEDFKNFIENSDGSICACIPLKWIKINPGSNKPRNLTDEQRKAIAERFKEARKK